MGHRIIAGLRRLQAEVREASHGSNSGHDTARRLSPATLRVLSELLHFDQTSSGRDHRDRELYYKLLLSAVESRVGHAALVDQMYMLADEQI